MMTPISEDQRRAELRAFLIQSRARLTPADVGLPQTDRRRVIGLRREEVAELAGVSNDWYRWFEAGRPINVSAAFLARLAQALRLNALEQRKLYDLALADLFSAKSGESVSLRPAPLLTPIQSLDELDSVVRRLAVSRERFLSDSFTPPSDVRPRIANSWRRSVMIGANAERKEVPPAAPSENDLFNARNASKQLLDAAVPTVSHLQGLIVDSGYAIVIANASGCILKMTADQQTLRALSRIDFEPGGDLSESACGTNAVGTTLADGRPIQLVGAENFCEGGSDLTCTAAPIHDPTTLEIVGVLDVTANYRRIHPEMISVITEAALEIEERLVTPAFEQKPAYRVQGR
jgi:transcriptional regulator with XRE-family HTH domain